MTVNILERSGFAALSDLQTQDWRGTYELLEKVQAEFLALSSEFRSPEYIWPHDSLRTWSRIWEYPYAYYHLRRFSRSHADRETLKIADIGSGVTFFPFALSRLRYDVSCVDVDLVCERDLKAAIGVVPHAPGSVRFVRTDGQCLPFEDASLDAIYSISVLEHVPHFEKVLGEIHRVLKPCGRLVLTFDVDFRGDSELSVESFSRAIAVLEDLFTYASPERPVHPSNILDSRNSPYGTRVEPVTLLGALHKAAARMLRRRGRAGEPWHLAIYAGNYAPRA
jgi:SAM-dependent methyltransferase